MSPRAWKLRIHDILDGIKDIKSFIADRTREQFSADKKTYLAVIRSLEVIGEAAHHTPDAIKKKYPEIPWRKIKDFRNVLVHQYFGIDNDIIWKTINDELLSLVQVFEKILSQESE
ncbi:MAG: DUF86 domain-containing protein [Oligoflexia bacterium]|nr:DUF86 domain-containing protein [Oligoflexia bacterium]